MVHSSSGDFWTLLGTVLYPFLAIWRLISNFLFSNPPPAQTSVRAASLETSNLASSSNSEKRYLCFPHLQNILVMPNALFKMEKKKIYRYFAFFLCKGENPACSEALLYHLGNSYLSFLSHLSRKSIPC